MQGDLARAVTLCGFAAYNATPARCQRECRGFESHHPLFLTAASHKRQRCLSLDTGASYGVPAKSSPRPRNTFRIDRRGPGLTATDARTWKVQCKVKRSPRHERDTLWPACHEAGPERKSASPRSCVQWSSRPDKRSLKSREVEQVHVAVGVVVETMATRGDK